MSRLVALAVLLLTACSSDSTAPPPTGTISSSITHDGMEREYILYVPASYSGEEAVPLVLNFHGYTWDAERQMGYGDFRAIADTAGFIVAHPQGSMLQTEQGEATHWNVGGWTLNSTTDDVAFTAALLDSLSAEYNIDPDRIYSTGMSNGGYMSYLLACRLPDRIAAVASVTGSMTPQTLEACEPDATPVLQIHGTEDGVVPYDGNPAWTHSMETVVDYWVGINGAEAAPDVSMLPDTNTDDGSTATRMVYDGDAPVVHIRIDGGGHTWPGATENFGSTNYDFNASAEIWSFFSNPQSAIRNP